MQKTITDSKKRPAVHSFYGFDNDVFGAFTKPDAFTAQATATSKEIATLGQIIGVIESLRSARCVCFVRAHSYPGRGVAWC